MPFRANHTHLMLMQGVKPPGMHGLLLPLPAPAAGLAPQGMAVGVVTEAHAHSHHHRNHNKSTPTKPAALPPVCLSASTILQQLAESMQAPHCLAAVSGSLLDMPLPALSTKVRQ